MDKIIKSVNFGSISKTLATTKNKIVQKVEDDFDPSQIEILDEKSKDDFSHKLHLKFSTPLFTPKFTYVHFYFVLKLLLVYRFFRI